jgi:hypothetical protein
MWLKFMLPSWLQAFASPVRGALWFPLSVLFNTYSTTGLLIVAGLMGDMTLVVAIGLVQGATLATFHMFSANGRNLILSHQSDDTVFQLARLRALLVIPLCIVVYLLVATFGQVSLSVVTVLLARRGCEWFGEIGLAEHEKLNRPEGCARSVILELVALSTFALLYFVLKAPFYLSASVWAIIPLVALKGISLRSRAKHSSTSGTGLLFNVGSTAIVGITVYAFRVALTSLADQETTGELFTAFAIGGIVPTILGQIMGPTMLMQYGHKLRSLKRTLLIVIFVGLLGLTLCAIALLRPTWLIELRLSQLFLSAIGFSLIGGGLMTVALLLRARFIHLGQQLVLGPDLLANTLLLIAVYPIYVLFGPVGLAALYLLSACLNTLYFFLFTKAIDRSREITRRIQLYVALLLVSPIFFLWDGSVYSDLPLDASSGSRIENSPLPLAIFSVSIGVGILANYAAIKRSMVFLLSIVVILVLTVAAQQGSDPVGTRNPNILWPQLVLPMIGVLLGEMYSDAQAWRRFAWGATIGIFGALALQLVAAWSQGDLTQAPSTVLFSIYQYFLYFPSISVALATFAVFALWHTNYQTRIVLTCFLILVSLQVVIARSLTGAIELALGLAVFTICHWRDRVTRNQMVVVLLVLAVASILYSLALDAVSYREWMILQELQVTRSQQWRYFLDKVMFSYETLFLGNPTPLDRALHPSAYNYWLDVLYSFGLLPLIPVIVLFFYTIREAWRQQNNLLSNPLLVSTGVIVFNLFFVESFFGAGLRQPYSGTISYFFLGCLIAQLKPRFKK